jgi:lysophospholipase L1-like esterase
MMSAPASDEVRILALGDSYTIGESVDEDQAWPARLVAMLRAGGVIVAPPVIIAQNGWTTDELSAAIDAVRPRGSFDIVTLLIGVNNQYRGRPIEEYQEQFADLLDRAIGFAAGVASHVIVLSIPDWAATPFANGRDRDRIATEIDAFNVTHRAEARRVGARYVDVTSSSRRAVSEPKLLADDDLHPSGEMYAIWADLVLPVALDILGIRHFEAAQPDEL